MINRLLVWFFPVYVLLMGLGCWLIIEIGRTTGG